MPPELLGLPAANSPNGSVRSAAARQLSGALFGAAMRWAELELSTNGRYREPLKRRVSGTAFFSAVPLPQSRPELSSGLEQGKFLGWYWHKSELAEFCRRQPASPPRETRALSVRRLPRPSPAIGNPAPAGRKSNPSLNTTDMSANFIGLIPGQPISRCSTPGGRNELESPNYRWQLTNCLQNSGMKIAPRSKETRRIPPGCPQMAVRMLLRASVNGTKSFRSK